MTDRRAFITSGLGLAGIIAAGRAPAALVRSAIAARQVAFGGGGGVVPSDYTQVSYIYGSGEIRNRPYLDTLVKPGHDIGISVDAAVHGFNHDKGGFVGCSKKLFVEGGAWYIYFENISNQSIDQIVQQTSDSSVCLLNLTHNLPLGHRALFEFNLTGDKIVSIKDGSTEFIRYVQAGSYYVENENIGIFRMLNTHYDTTGAYYYDSFGKLFGAKLYKAGSLIADLKPCVRAADGKVGVYDVVRRLFLHSPISAQFNYVL